MALDLDIQRHTMQMWARRVSFLLYEDKARLLPGEKSCLRQMGPARSFLGDGGAQAGGCMFGQGKGVWVQRLGSEPSPILLYAPCPPCTSSCSPWEEKCCDPRLTSEAGTLPAFAQAGGGEEQVQPAPLSAIAAQGPGHACPTLPGAQTTRVRPLCAPLNI